MVSYLHPSQVSRGYKDQMPYLEAKANNRETTLTV